MACVNEHRIFNLLAVSAASAIVESREGNAPSATPLAMGLAAYCFPSLPDHLEPALHPNHRKFFHSLAFAGLVGYGMYRAYQWEPEDRTGDLLRFAGLALGAAYLAHLARDAFSVKSLPMI